MPTVAILMPTYEPKPEHLRAAIDSVRAQTEQDWTLFIHDDASKADVRAMVESALADPRITFKKSERNIGIGGNWNACVHQTQSEFIQFVFQDDLLEPQYLTQALAALRAYPSAVFAASPHEYHFEGGESTHPMYEQLLHAQRAIAPGLHQGKDFLLRWLDHELHPNVIGEPSFVLLRREAMEKIGPFDEVMRQSLDSEYWVRCLLHGDWVLTEKSAGAFRVHAAGTSARNQAEGKGLFDRFIILERTMHALHGRDRARAHAAIVRALSVMIRKFFRRRKEGHVVSMGGSGAVKRFALRHPLLTLRAMIPATTKEGCHS